MTRFALALLLGFIALLAAAEVSAQRTSGGVNFVVAVPQGSFADRLDDVGFGLTGTLVHHFAGSPVGVGAEGTFATYSLGTASFSSPAGDVLTTNNIAMGHVILRLQSPSGMIRPYGDALVGLGYLFTESRIEDVDFNGDRYTTSSTNFDDAAFSYGLGGGVMAQVYSGHSSDDGRPFNVFVDARIRYLFGGEAQYLREGDIESDANGNPIYFFTESRTDLLLPQLGVTIRF